MSDYPQVYLKEDIDTHCDTWTSEGDRSEWVRGDTGVPKGQYDLCLLTEDSVFVDDGSDQYEIGIDVFEKLVSNLQVTVDREWKNKENEK